MNKAISSSWPFWRAIAYLFLGLICLWWWLDNFLSAHYFNWFITCTLTAAVAGFFVRKKKMDIFMGFIMLTGALYMVAAIINAYGRWSVNSHSAALTVMIFWAAIFLVLLALAHLLIFSSVFSDHYPRDSEKNAGTEPGI